MLKKQQLIPLFLLFVLFVCLSAGIFFGRNFCRSIPPVLISGTAQPNRCAVIDLNLADEAALTALPGVGQALARRILDYRKAHGPFTCVSELLNIEGIGEARFERLLPYITAGG